MTSIFCGHTKQNTGEAYFETANGQYARFLNNDTAFLTSLNVLSMPKVSSRLDVGLILPGTQTLGRVFKHRQTNAEFLSLVHVLSCKPIHCAAPISILQPVQTSIPGTRKPREESTGRFYRVASFGGNPPVRSSRAPHHSALTRFIPASEVSIHKGGRRGFGSHDYYWRRLPGFGGLEFFHQAGPGQGDVLPARGSLVRTRAAPWPPQVLLTPASVTCALEQRPGVGQIHLVVKALTDSRRQSPMASTLPG